MDPRYLQLAESEHAVSIIGNPETGDYILLDVRQAVPPAASKFARIVVDHGMRHLGVIGIVGGVPRVALAVPVDAESIATLAHTFVQQAGAEAMPARITAEVERPVDDFVTFMDRLWALEDPRSES